MRFRNLPLLGLLVALALTIAAACGDDESSEDRPEATPTPAAAEETPEPTPEPASVKFMAGFKPQANLPFVGAYIAQEKGYFAEESLQVEIQHVTTPGDNFRFLGAGEIQFTTADATALLERRAGDPPLPFASIALLGQKGQQGFAVLADSGIQTPADWAGKTAGYKGSQVTPDYLAILEANGLERGQVNEVRVGFEPQILTERQVDIYPVFLANEPDTLRRIGYDVKVFEAADYGAPTIGLTYVTTEQFIQEKPDVVRRFLRAVLRGIQYADENRDEAVQIVMQYAPQEDPEHQRFMLDTELHSAKLGHAQTRGIGWQTLEQWQALHDFLVQYGALSGPLDDVSAAFTDRFLKQVYADGPRLD